MRKIYEFLWDILEEIFKIFQKKKIQTFFNVGQHDSVFICILIVKPFYHNSCLSSLKDPYIFIIKRKDLQNTDLWEDSQGFREKI